MRRDTTTMWLTFDGHGVQNGYPAGYGKIRNLAMEREGKKKPNDNSIIGYSAMDSGVWQIKSGFGSGAKPLIVRVNRFDIKDTKRCDSRDKNDQDWAFHMEFNGGDGTKDLSMCHTIGEDRQRHQRERSHNRSFRSGMSSTL